jgi:hypothetical protein
VCDSSLGIDLDVARTSFSLLPEFFPMYCGEEMGSDMKNSE